MAQACTPLDLIRLIYRETGSEEENRIRQQIAEDQNLAAEYCLLLDSVRQLDGLSEEPSETSVNLILEYSRQPVEEHSPI